VNINKGWSGLSLIKVVIPFFKGLKIHPVG
jgi:hypothetical protein